VHSEEELKRSLCEGVTAVGVNNRDLKSFEVSLDTSHRIAEKIPAEFVRVSESGIKSAEDILALRKSGYQGFLIGERFMSRAQPQRSCARLVRDLEEARRAEEGHAG
jgi:indole-3-glycerol phosphate synthase